MFRSLLYPVACDSCGREQDSAHPRLNSDLSVIMCFDISSTHAGSHIGTQTC